MEQVPARLPKQVQAPLTLTFTHLKDYPMADPSAPTASSAPSAAPTNTSTITAPSPNMSAAKPGAPRPGANTSTATSGAGANKPSVGGQVDLKASPAPEKTADKTEAARRRYEFKINGKNEVREFTPEEETRWLQKGLAADASFQEVAKQRKQIEAFIAAGKNGDDLGEIAKRLWGVDLDEYAEKKLAEKFQRSTMTDEEKERLDLKAENEKYKKQFERLESDNKSAAQKQYEEKIWAETDRDVLKALNDSGLERNRESLHLIADVAESALAQGIELTPAQMVAEARERATSFAKGTLFKLAGVQLLDALGTDVVNKVLQAELARRRGSVANPVQAPAPAPAAPRTHRSVRAPEPAPVEEAAPMSAVKRRTLMRMGVI